MSILQDILIILLAFWMVIDQQGPVITTWFPVIIAMFAGFILGDIQTAMVIGGTFQLMALGVANIGGSSVPNYGLAALVGVYVAIRTTGNIVDAKAAALAVGVPVGMLGIQLDVLGKILTNPLVHKAEKYAHNGQYKKMNQTILFAPLIFGLTTALPTALFVIFGKPIVSFILEVLPKWFTNGLSIAGGILPVVGIGILISMMPIKKHLMYLIIGFIAAAYLKMPMMGVALVGAAAAYNFFRQKVASDKNVALNNNTASDADIEDGDFDE
ncbi:PTS sugar transporter subunit IIC [Leuconostoc suionicum]|uniref:PTS mannose/fructose/sorbose/N-acetylgalactosamine transporter subunit IIC n=1 Tax=Leuconostoc suionicum TaxID=1511761 RepID=UPI00233F6016|nr:PTS sugar transporter subunit IIC [Leuconostoc suionicum]MDC2805157.1 PTS sugar transporter subunit IIC [Leuconostoc suionicum]MDC2817431.1 PTS sugar transporter subunit IIC [Leuconostoc suionicum]MDC2822669.1 PTS sugar transporter subunit IIC [Leuconostoc suionicum]